MAIPVKNITRTTYIPKGSVEHIVSPAVAGKIRHISSIDLMGVSYLLPGYLVVRTPSYPFHVLLMVRRGVLHFRDHPSRGETRDFPADSMLFLPAGTWYLYSAEEPLELVWFHLCPNSSEWHFLENVKRFDDAAVDLECLRSLISVLYRESNATMKDESGLSWYGLRMIELLLRRILKRFAPEADHVKRVRTLFDSMEVSLEKQWTVSGMARQAGISPSALFAVSRTYFGVSPMARLHELRMNAAANLLRNTTYKLDAIASMVGLGCGFSLSRAFHKFHGISPRDYRNNCCRKNGRQHELMEDSRNVKKKTSS